MFSRVVLPEPDSPMMATYSPSSTEKLTLDRAWTCVAAEAGGVDFLYMLYFQQWHQDSSSYRIMPLL